MGSLTFGDHQFGVSVQMDQSALRTAKTVAELGAKCGVAHAPWPAILL